MTPVFQTIVDSGRGNCMSAAIATLFDLEIEQVPHFHLFGHQWWDVFFYFIYALGYELNGSGYPYNSMKNNPYTPEELKLKLKEHGNVNGYLYAVVPSRTFQGVTHAVVIDLDGEVVHDPNPNKAWLGVNVVDTQELRHWYHIERRDIKKENKGEHQLC